MQFTYEFHNNLDEANFLKNKALGSYYADVIANIGLLLFKTKYFKVIVRNRKEDKVILSLIYKKQEIPLEIDSETVNIYLKEGIYTYQHNRGLKTLYLDLTGVLYECDDMKVGEMFNNDNVTFTILKDNLYFVLKIPMKPTKIYNPHIFLSLKKDSSLVNLKNIYQDYFLEEQKLDYYSYNLKETVLTVYDLTKDYSKLKNEFHLKGGFIVFEQYNTIVDKVQINITFNEAKTPLISIIGYTLTSQVDLNKEIANLLNRRNEIKTKGELRILKPSK